MPQSHPGQQWKHGWVPLTAAAARSKNHGRKVGAGSLLARMVAEAAENHKRTQAAKASSGQKGTPNATRTRKPSQSDGGSSATSKPRGRADDATTKRLDKQAADDARLGSMINEDRRRQENDPLYKRYVDLRYEQKRAGIEWEKASAEAYRLSQQYKRDGSQATKKRAESAAKRRDELSAKAQQLAKERDDARAISKAQPQNKKGASFSFKGDQWEIASDQIAVRDGVPNYVVKNTKTGQTKYAETALTDRIIGDQRRRRGPASQADAALRAMAAKRRTSR